MGLKGHLGLITQICCSFDGKKIASTSSDKTIKVWDFETGKELQSIEAHSHYVKSVSISQDGNYIVSGS